MPTVTNAKVSRRLVTLAAAAAMAASLSFPMLAFADVNIDGKAINQGANEVGGGTATLTETVLDMVNVVAGNLSTDQDLTVNFNGGNEIDQFSVTGSAEVTANFSGDNAVDDITTLNNANLTINANGHNEFDDVDAKNGSNITINVTGENSFESISGSEDANITIKGTDCQKKDIVNIEGEAGMALAVVNGDLTVDHVTVNIEGTEMPTVGSETGNVVIDTSKISASDDAWTLIVAGGTMQIIESVIEIAGEVSSVGKMTIKHSDVKASKPDTEYAPPYRVFSRTGIELIDEKNGEVKEGEFDGQKVWYVDTDDNEGSDVDLKADGEPAYYKCKSDDDDDDDSMPRTGDTTKVPPLTLLALASASTALLAGRRRWNDKISGAAHVARPTERF